MHDVDACRQAWEHVAPQPVQDSQAAMRDFARLHGHLAERVTTLRAWVAQDNSHGVQARQPRHAYVHAMCKADAAVTCAATRLRHAQYSGRRLTGTMRRASSAMSLLTGVLCSCCACVSHDMSPVHTRRKVLRRLGFPKVGLIAGSALQAAQCGAGLRRLRTCEDGVQAG